MPLPERPLGRRTAICDDLAPTFSSVALMKIDASRLEGQIQCVEVGVVVPMPFRFNTLQQGMSDQQLGRSRRQHQPELHVFSFHQPSGLQ